MKINHLTLLSILTLVVSSPVWAQGTGNMVGTSMPGADQAIKTGRGIEIIKIMDPTSRTVTFKDGPIPAIG